MHATRPFPALHASIRACQFRNALIDNRFFRSGAAAAIFASREMGV